MFETIFYAFIFPLAMIYGLHDHLLKILKSEQSIPVTRSIFNIERTPVSAATIKAMRTNLFRALSELPDNACRMIAISGLALTMCFLVDIALFSRADQLLSDAGADFLRNHQSVLSFSLGSLSAVIALYGIAFWFLSEKLKNRICGELNSLESADEHYHNSINLIIEKLPTPYNSKFETYSKTVEFYKRKLTVAEVDIARKIINNHKQKKEEQDNSPPEIFIP